MGSKENKAGECRAVQQRKGKEWPGPPVESEKSYLLLKLIIVE